MIQELRGSTALVTGASRGIGAFLATRLAAEGMHLVLAARDANRLDAVRAACEGLGVKVRAVMADVSVPSERERLIHEAGDIDVLINNAAIEITRAVADQTAADIAAQITTNLEAPIQLTRLVLPRFLARRRGTIVNVSSMSGKSATPFNAIYSATKFGLNGFSGSLRIELEGTGVHAGVVCPSFVGATGMWADSGLRAPTMMREVKPEKVVQGVIAVIRGAPEVLVTPGPIRPLLALREMFPGVDASVLRRLGVTDALKKRAMRPR
jgi:short-subunit dehydrogenase